MRRMALALLMTLSTMAALGCNSLQDAIYKDAIEKALRENALTGSAATDEHVRAMRSVDLTNCPPDFREAYTRYIRAWEETAAVHNAKAKLDGEEDAAAVAGVLTTMFGSNDTPWSDHVRAERELRRLEVATSTDLSASSRQVDDIAVKYGVQLSH